MARQALLPLLLIVALAGGCAVRKVNPIATEKFPARAADAEVKLYTNVDIERPHVKIAYVQSFAETDPDVETKKKQLEDLQKTARRVGGDAVINLRQLHNKVRGLVRDEAVPFPSVKQGSEEQVFYRAIAIRYVDAEQAELLNQPVPEGATSTADDGNGIPEVTTQDPAEGLDTETLPRGLGPVFR